MNLGMMKRRANVGEKPNYLITSETNPEVLTVCYAQGWCASPKGMTYEEAALVTNIGTAFQSNTKITDFRELQWFDGLTTIPDNAFNGCTNLITLGIPPNVTRYGSNCFINNTKLGNVYIRDLAAFCSITGTTTTNYISRVSETRLYLNDTLVDDLVIPNSVTSLPNLVFFHFRFNSITIPGTLKTFNYRCFEVVTSSVYPTVYCLPTLYDWVNDADRKGDSSFMGGSFPSGAAGLKYIGGNLIEGIIDIPDGVTVIGYASFKGASLATQFNIPNSVTRINQQAFDDCDTFTSINIPNTVTYIGGAAFRNCKNLTSIVIPDSVTTIASQAFANCTKLQSAIVSSGLKSIPYSVFSDCSSLTDITLRSSQLTSIDLRFIGNCYLLQNLYIYTKKAPTMSNWATNRNIGSNQTGEKTLFVPSDATGYDTGNWLNFCNTYGFTLSKTL